MTHGHGVRVEILTGRRPGHGTIVVNGDTALAELPGIDGVRRLPAAHLPGWVAAAVELGPRPAADLTGVLVTSPEVADAILGPEPLGAGTFRDRLGTGLSEAWVAAMAAVGATTVHRWRVTVERLDGHRLDRLEAADAGPAGLWALGPAGPGLVDVDEAVAIRPTTSTDVWSWLSRLAAHGKGYRFTASTSTRTVGRKDQPNDKER